MPDFTKTSTTTLHECEYKMAEIVSLLRFMKSYTQSPSINNIEAMDHLDELNLD